MHHSISLLSFRTKSGQTETTRSSESTDSTSRLRARSSLDTFVIPGRVRLPSSKPHQADLQITQRLLDQGEMQPQDKQAPGPHRTGCSKIVPAVGDGSPVVRAESRKHHVVHPTVPVRVRPVISMQPPPRFGSREVIVVPHQRPRKDEYKRMHALTVDQGQAYDGADEPEQAARVSSRTTSMTWSTVSHRVLTDSSCSSRRSRASQYREQYNQLAEMHGLQRMAAASSDDDKTKVTTKSRQHGWIARKLFRRSSSTYTLKAKTTYRPLTRKKSLGGIRLLAEGAPKNIVKGKSLEEIGRLGGLGVLILPHDFAADKLTLPICLSATATYLCQHGRNAPGIFRVSGQASTISALYDFYDHQFYHAGSPSKVEETVGSGMLPSNIEHTVSDVASVFKKILIGLPGGLLGSLELFDAIRDVLLNLCHDAELSDSENALLRAKLIALSISSLSSAYRVYLIQAVLGLAAYFGSEAEKAEVGSTATDGQEQQNQLASELMGYQSLGVVLGPLLLGDLTDKVDIGRRESLDGTTRTSTDGMKKSKKQKRSSASNKLERGATLSAHIDRANLTASIVQTLLMSWKDVVGQFREINNPMSASCQTKSSTGSKKVPSRPGSRLTLNSEEDLLFRDALRGRKLPDEFPGGAIVKHKVRISSKSPMSRGAMTTFKASEDDQRAQQTYQPVADEEHADQSPMAAKAIGAMEESFRQPVRPYHAARDEEVTIPVEDVDRLQPYKRTNSDIAMERMSMGTILTRPEDTPICVSSHNLPSSRDTLQERRRQRSSSDLPTTAIKAVPMNNVSQTLPPTPRRLQPFLDKPLPPITDLQKAERLPQSSEEDGAAVALRKVSRQNRPSRRQEETPALSTRELSPRASFPTAPAPPKSLFPPRQSSMPMEAPLGMKPLETYNSLAEYRAKSDAYMSPPNVLHFPKASDIQVNEEELPVPGEKRNSVKFLAQQFAEASTGNHKADQVFKDAVSPAQDYTRPMPIATSPLEDPFTSYPTRTPSPEKDSLIPKPVRTVGRDRRGVSRSPSPSKQTTPRSSRGKRPSLSNMLHDRDAEIVKQNTLVFPEHLMTAKGDPYAMRPGGLTSSTDQYRSARPLSTASTESHRLSSPALEGPSLEHPNPNRMTTLARSRSPDSASSPGYLNKNPSIDGLTRSNSYFDASDNLKALERHGSINTTLYSEICRLQRMLEQRGEEVLAARRGLHGAREMHNDGGNVRERRGSWGRGKAGLDDEVRAAREESGRWKRRAERLEAQLRDVKARFERAEAEAGDALGEDKANGRGVGMEVEVKIWGKGDEAGGAEYEESD